MRGFIREGRWWLLAGFLSAVVGCGVKAPMVKPEPITIYVAPDGNDNADGSEGAPIASIQRALLEVRSRRGANRTIYLRGGTYFLKEPLQMTERDSGEASAPLVIAAYGSERPVLSGGRRVTGWKVERFNGRACWVAELPDVAAGSWYFQELWVNGQRATRARHPNHGYFKVAAVPDKPLEWNIGQKRFGFAAGDVLEKDVPGDAEVVVCSRWMEGRLPIAGIDQDSHVISVGKRNAYEIQLNDCYWLEGAPQWLDEEGEWYLDKKKGRLYYAPRAGEEPEKTLVVAPAMAGVLHIDGSKGEGKFVEYVTLRDLTFSHTEWLMPEPKKPTTHPTHEGFWQAAESVPGAVLVNGARRCEFAGCRFENVGGYGIELAQGCQQNTISACEFLDLGAGGVKIGEEQIRDDEFGRTFGNAVSDCRIRDGGRFYPSGVGVWLGQTGENTIAHNSIHDFFYTGVSVGWTWGYKQTLAKKNVIEFNEIHHIGKLANGDGPILSDMGAIYTLGVQPGTVIRSNICHDIAGIKYGGWGIYLDEGSSDILVENNLVYYTTSGGFHQHYGKDNLIRNNIFAFGRDQQLQRSRPENHKSFTFERNIVYWPTGSLGQLSGGKMSFIDNLFWQTGSKEIKIGNEPFDKWQQRVKAQGSVIADPIFVDAERLDFRLKPGSPAEAIGFMPMDLSGVGPRKLAATMDHRRVNPRGGATGVSKK